MCGIAGYWSKSDTDGAAGDVLLSMLTGLGRRGPDSAGIALYDVAATAARGRLGARPGGPGTDRGRAARGRTSVDRGTDRSRDEAPLAGPPGARASRDRRRAARRGRATLGGRRGRQPRRAPRAREAGGRPGGAGGHVRDRGGAGSHGIGHTRLSTESRVDLVHSQPFWAHGVADLATVHNGHITNYHKLRRRYEQRASGSSRENDSEVIGVYLADQLERGCTLERGARAIRSTTSTAASPTSSRRRTRSASRAIRSRFKPLITVETDGLRRDRQRGDRDPRMRWVRRRRARADRPRLSALAPRPASRKRGGRPRDGRPRPSRHVDRTRLPTAIRVREINRAIRAAPGRRARRRSSSQPGRPAQPGRRAAQPRSGRRSTAASATTAAA